ncbi:MAG TPA: gamma-glutamyltransferase family protein [Acidimicrobiales bacterium]|nr:gamma-glutamyltransferase family protein [Acidimicrobiales bacterium]
MDFTTRPEITGTFGVVASTHWLASASGMAVLEQGGNAFDAAVAAGMTLQVVEPDMNGPGGDLPALLWPAGSDQPAVLCAQGPAPQQATLKYYRDELGLRIIPGTGPLAAVVPGAFGGWLAMLRDFGTLHLRDVLRFAIGYAGNGYPMLARTDFAIRSLEALFRDHWTTSGDVYLPATGAGGMARNRVLADTYQRLVDEAEARSPNREGQIEAALDIWYRGWVAEALIIFQGKSWLDSTGERHHGLLDGDDLASWAPTYEVPLSTSYGGYTIFKTGPWGQGPVFLQQLQLLAGFDLKAMGHGSPEYVHTITECAKLAFADREAWYGDPNFVDVPMDELLSKDYADERRKLVSDESSPELRPGAPGGRLPRLPEFVTGGDAAAAGAGEPAVRPAQGDPAHTGDPALRGDAGVRGDTVHLDVVDCHGNMVSATPSGGWLTGAPVVPELGFCLGTRGQMFWLEEGLASSLEPGKRPRTTLSPTIVARDGEPRLALGTPGGDQQDQWTLHAFLAHVNFGIDLQMAIDSPNHHTEAFPSSFYPRAMRPQHLAIEQRTAPGTIEPLRAYGHRVEPAPPWSLGRVCAVSRDRDGLLRGAADPRGMQCYVCGR